MPIYEYVCEKCDHEFEREQRITDDPVKTCPKCRARRVKRLISQTSFVLKGSGWYSDLYASNSGKSEDKSADGEGAAKPEKGAEKGADKGDGADAKSEKKRGGSDDGKSSKASKPGGDEGGKSKSKKAAA